MLSLAERLSALEAAPVWTRITPHWTQEAVKLQDLLNQTVDVVARRTFEERFQKLEPWITRMRQVQTIGLVSVFIALYAGATLLAYKIDS